MYDCLFTLHASANILMSSFNQKNVCGSTGNLLDSLLLAGVLPAY